MTLDEAVKIMSMKNPALCKYPDCGSLRHLSADGGGYCIICGEKLFIIKKLTEVYEKARSIVLATQ